ncbi:gfo/Idh/MocA family oxidoreductase [Candidatus Woesearchaeota archaeon]|nr:MAG: gfo/Idh/MocA family oxidoreductase [Candidatus Woesearchaeota archaeon]
MINYAIVGCGRVSSYHANAIVQDENSRLVACCEVKTDQLKQFSRTYNCKPYTDINEMLNNENIDVVIIATGNSSHLKLIDIAAKHKKHILCEKPLALTKDDCVKAINLCKENNVKLYEVKQNRFNKPVAKLKNIFDDGKLGKLVLGNSTIRWFRDQDYYDKNEWHGKRNTDGGMLYTQAIHDIDLLLWFMGNVRSVQSNMATLLHNIETEDVATAILEFENGALGVIEATTCTYPKDTEGSLTIIGDKGTVKIGGISMNKVDIWQVKDDNTDTSELNTYPENVYGFGHKDLISCLTNSLIENKDSSFLVDGKQALKSVEVIEAIIKSAETGQKVYIQKT